MTNTISTMKPLGDILQGHARVIGMLVSLFVLVFFAFVVSLSVLTSVSALAAVLGLNENFVVNHTVVMADAYGDAFGRIESAADVIHAAYVEANVKGANGTQLLVVPFVESCTSFVLSSSAVAAATLLDAQYDVIESFGGSRAPPDQKCGSRARYLGPNVHSDRSVQFGLAQPHSDYFQLKCVLLSVNVDQFGREVRPQFRSELVYVPSESVLLASSSSSANVSWPLPLFENSRLLRVATSGDDLPKKRAAMDAITRKRQSASSISPPPPPVPAGFVDDVDDLTAWSHVPEQYTTPNLRSDFLFFGHLEREEALGAVNAMQHRMVIINTILCVIALALGAAVLYGAVRSFRTLSPYIVQDIDAVSRVGTQVIRNIAHGKVQMGASDGGKAHQFRYSDTAVLLANFLKHLNSNSVRDTSKRVNVFHFGLSKLPWRISEETQEEWPKLRNSDGSQSFKMPVIPSRSLRSDFRKYITLPVRIVFLLKIILLVAASVGLYSISVSELSAGYRTATEKQIFGLANAKAQRLGEFGERSLDFITFYASRASAVMDGDVPDWAIQSSPAGPNVGLPNGPFPQFAGLYVNFEYSLLYTKFTPDVEEQALQQVESNRTLYLDSFARVLQAGVGFSYYEGTESGVFRWWPYQRINPPLSERSYTSAQTQQTIRGFDPRHRSWYVETLAANKPILSAPYIDSASGQVVISATSPFRDRNGAITGVAGVDLDAALLAEIASTNGLGEGGATFIADYNGRIIFHEQGSVDEVLAVADVEGDQFAEALRSARADFHPSRPSSAIVDVPSRSLFFAWATVPSLQYVVVISMPEPRPEVVDLKTLMIVLAAVVVVLLIVVYLINDRALNSMLMRPLKTMSQISAITGQEAKNGKAFDKLLEKQAECEEVSLLNDNLSDALLALRFGDPVVLSALAFDDKMKLFSIVEDLFTRLDEPLGIAVCQANKGTLHMQEKQYQEALQCFEKAIEIGRAHKCSEVALKMRLLGVLMCQCYAGDLSKQDLLRKLDIEIGQADDNSPYLCALLLRKFECLLESMEIADPACSPLIRSGSSQKKKKEEKKDTLVRSGSNQKKKKELTRSDGNQQKKKKKDKNILVQSIGSQNGKKNKETNDEKEKEAKGGNDTAALKRLNRDLKLFCPKVTFDLGKLPFTDGDNPSGPTSKDQMVENQVSDLMLSASRFRIGLYHLEVGNRDLALEFFGAALETGECVYSSFHDMIIRTLQQHAGLFSSLRSIGDWFESESWKFAGRLENQPTPKDIVFVVDQSGSMNFQCGIPVGYTNALEAYCAIGCPRHLSRYAIAMSNLQLLVDRFIGPNDGMCILGFSSEVSVIADYAIGLKNVLLGVEKAKRSAVGGSTSCYDALHAAYTLDEVCSRSSSFPSQRVVILLTDGDDTSSRQVNPRELGQMVSRKKYRDWALFVIVVEAGWKANQIWTGVVNSAKKAGVKMAELIVVDANSNVGEAEHHFKGMDEAFESIATQMTSFEKFV